MNIMDVRLSSSPTALDSCLLPRPVDTFPGTQRLSHAHTITSLAPRSSLRWSHRARFSSRLTSCVLRQTSATVAACKVVVLDRSAVAGRGSPDEIVGAGSAPVGDATVAAPLLSGPRDLLEPSRSLGVVLGEGVAFEGVVRSVEVRWSGESGAVLSLKAVGKLAAAATPPPKLTFQENLQQFIWLAGLEPGLRITARGLAGGLQALRWGASAEISGLRDGWSGSYKIGRLEWTWDLERGGLTAFEARRAA